LNKSFEHKATPDNSSQEESNNENDAIDELGSSITLRQLHQVSQVQEGV
jgi:hypothetical protein